MKNNSALAAIVSATICGGIAVGIYYIFQDNINRLIGINSTSASPQTLAPSPVLSPIPSPILSPALPGTSGQLQEANPLEAIDTSLPNPQMLTMDGSVTMVRLMKLLRNGYGQVNPNIVATYGLDPSGQPKEGEGVRPSGSDKGLKNLTDGKVILVAVSRPLQAEEIKAGVKAIPIARDAIAVVVGKDNPFRGNLTKAQLRDIYAGKITNWSEVGGANSPIKVYNRSSDSGTQGFFQDEVLLGGQFAADSANFKTWERDETTAVLRVLGNNGIYYTTVSQAERQEIIRIVPIDGVSPENRKAILDRTYPIVRYIYLAIPKQSSPAVKQFISFVLSPEGQRIVEQADFIRLK